LEVIAIARFERFFRTEHWQRCFDLFEPLL